MSISATSVLVFVIIVPKNLILPKIRFKLANFRYSSMEER